jgi:NADPH:quinone reductase-like Zn-dependent oxidoreductase
VTGVCSTRNLDLVRSIGADHAIDYTNEDFTKSGELYDVILDCVGNHSMSETRRVLNPKGTYVPIGGPTDNWMIGPIASSIGTLIAAPFISQTFVNFFVAKIDKDDLEILGELIEGGKVTPVIDKRYGLEDVPAAIRYLEEGHARGKVMIIVES